MMFLANKPRFGIGGFVMKLKLRSNVNPSIALPNHSTSHRGTALAVNSSFSADTYLHCRESTGQFMEYLMVHTR